MGNVVLTGGGSLFAGFADRLETELSRNFPHVSIARARVMKRTELIYKGENTRARKPHRKTIRRMVGRQHPGEFGHVSSVVDKQRRVAGLFVPHQTVLPF